MARPLAAHSEASPPPAGSTRSRYRDNLARHLIGISRDLQSRVRSALETRCGYAGLRPSFGPLLALLWNEARPLGFLASELAISNQAASQLANLAERAGYLAREPHPTDRRSRLVALTPRGRSVVEDGMWILRATEAEYAALLGSGRYRHLTRALGELYCARGLTAHADSSLDIRASPSIGVLSLLSEQIQRELMEATSARGHRGLKMSHGQVLPLIGPDGGRIGQLARIQRVSRQAICATTQDLEELGYLRRGPDPRDRRGVVLELTRQGERLIEDSVSSLDALEAGFREVLGADRLERLKRAARGLYDALGLEREVFEIGSGAEARAAASGARTSARTGSHPRRRGDRGRDGAEIEQLATRLRRWLGSGDAARLAAELDPRETERNLA
ncbi:MAG TPA: MarR family transcriptional regulator [Myxococcota bacterium]|nr:MarR family transcriptional regulator [Myxococcota bacterium]